MTGANGFVGAALCRELSLNNIYVIGVVREGANITSINGIRNLCIVYADLSQYSQLADIIKDRDIDVFYHFAWMGTAGEQRGDIDIQISNVRYTCDAVKACHSIGCRRFVFASSIMEYEIEAIMKTEAYPSINTLYSSAKAMATYMARTMAGALEIDFIRTVISNIYGPGETSPRLVNTTIRKMLRGEPCSFSAGEQIYDFIYITDAAKAFIAVGERGIANRTYYIGSLNPKPLKDFLVELRDQVDESIELGLGKLPFNGVSLTYTEFDIQAVKKDTGFVPTIGFTQGIKNTIKWIKEGM